MANKTAPLCTTIVEFELSMLFLPNFAGTVKFVAKNLLGMGSLCLFGVVHDWYCLIDSLVIWHSHVTCVFIANTSYISLACCMWYSLWSIKLATLFSATGGFRSVIHVEYMEFIPELG